MERFDFVLIPVIYKVGAAEMSLWAFSGKRRAGLTESMALPDLCAAGEP